MSMEWLHGVIDYGVIGILLLLSVVLFCSCKKHAELQQLRRYAVVVHANGLRQRTAQDGSIRKLGCLELL